MERLFSLDDFCGFIMEGALVGHDVPDVLVIFSAVLKGVENIDPERLACAMIFDFRS